MSSPGLDAAFDALLQAVDRAPVREPVHLPTAEVAEGATWLLDQGLALARSSERPLELLDATAAALAEPSAEALSRVPWALYVLTHELTGDADTVDAALNEGLASRPGACWVGLAQAVATMTVLHELGGAAAWVRARRPV